MQIELIEQRLVAARAAAVFALATDADRFPDLFRGCGPIPALSRIALHGPLAVGTTRAVESSDGSCMTETITEFVADQRHAYTLSGIRPPLAWLARAGQADWRFDEVAGGTRVRWQYRFELSSPLAWPLAAPLLQLFMRVAMRRCLRALADTLDAARAD